MKQVNIKQKLLFWDEVFPCDIDKPEGHLYDEALAAIEQRDEKLAKVLDYLEDRVKWFQDSAKACGSGTSQRREKWRAKVASDILGEVRKIIND